MTGASSGCGGDDTGAADHYSLAWVVPDTLATSLDSATYLETTDLLRKSGWNVTLIAIGPPGVQQIRGIETRCFRRARPGALGHARWHLDVLAWIRRQRPDVVLFPAASAPYFLPLRWTRRLFGRTRPLLVMDMRGLAAALVLRPTSSKSLVRRLHFRLAHWGANRWADGQTAISERLARVVKVPPARLLGIWPSGVDLARFSGAARGRRWPGPGEPVEFVYIGIFHELRNLEAMARAVLLARQRGHPLRLTLIGDGPARPALEALASSSDGCVRVRPRIPHVEVPRALTEMHVGVLPFLDLEIYRVSSFLKLFEYLAAGLPVLATPIVSIQNVLGDGDHVFWADDSSAESLSRAAGRACEAWARLPELGGQAERAARPFDWSASALILHRALVELLSAHPRRPRLTERLART